MQTIDPPEAAEDLSQRLGAEAAIVLPADEQPPDKVNEWKPLSIATLDVAEIKLYVSNIPNCRPHRLACG
ncbi:hypothetical protein Trco_001599 [Trichoderma cornu-damae]|uniref:Uncharacterized protein n=1 Tax=Trichoderma cornu-damae TaxID=654480 RepID=A0A9P8QUL3_9HYPO|nr:hypothetical protein Trco_001599 [Trichoderma cornu-damae]